MNDRYYIGGGIIAMVLGISPFGTPLDAYYAITGERPIDIADEKQQFFEERKEWEPVAFQRFTRKTGLEIVRCNHRYTDRVWSWARAEIDFELEDGSNGETKTVDMWSAPYWGIAGIDEPPAYITAQAMWGLGVTLSKRCYVQRFGLNDNHIYLVERDEDLIIQIRERAHYFWTRHVEPRRPPPPSSLEDVLKLYGKGTSRAVEASDAVMEAMVLRKTAMHKIAIAENEKLQAELIVKKFMADASVLTKYGKPIATWKADTRGIRKFLAKD